MSRNPLGFRLIAFVVLGLALASAQAATITVNSAADTAANDGVCTLREAIIAANTNTASGAMAGECIAGDILPTVDVIEFAIAGAGVHTITPLTTLPIISQAVTINGYSQTGSSANTNAMSAGINAVLLIEIDTENFTQLRVTGANTTIRGLVINRGVDKIVVAADGVTIAGNFLGTNAAGTAALSSVSGGFGVRHESGNNMTVGGAAAADRNLISGNVQGGVTTDLGFSNTFTGHLIQGNYIGPDVTGTLSLSSGASTAAITSLNNATVRGNLISGNGGGGIVMAHASGTGPVIVQGNLIGTQRDGTSALGNGQSGLSILSSSNAIGGTAAGEGNTIAFNTVSGVALANNIDSNRILGNSIHSNGGLGISLNGNSPGTPLPNDAGDADTLPGNNGQNYPVVTSASFSAGNVVVSGTLNSTASTTFRLEFFVNPACDTSLHGEGKNFIGFGTVTTDAGGNASFNGLSFASATGGAITATATVNPSAGVFTDTSEFSVCTATLLPPVITKNFLSPTIQAGALSQVGLSITIQNPNPQVPGDFTANHLTGVGFTDTLPGALILFTPSGLTGSCSGVTAVGGSNQVTMSNGTVGAGLTCTILVTVNAPAGTPSGLLHNVTSNVTSIEGGSGNAGASDITVQGVAVAAPLFSKQFGAQTMALGASTSLTFTITNTNVSTLTGVAFSDTLPAGLVVASPNGLTGSCGGGTITAVAGTNVVSLATATLTAGQQCQFAVNVTSSTAGAKSNTTGTIASTESGVGSTASASVTVVAPPTISKAFGGATIAVNASTSLTFTLTNPNSSVALTGVAFSDTLQSGLVVATPNGVGGTCVGGTVTAVAGSGIVSLSGQSIAANGSCTLSINVTGTTEGLKSNTTAAITSTNGGTGVTSNTATVTVVAASLTIAKAFGAQSIALHAGTSLTFTLTNSSASLALTGVAFTDPLPSGLVVATPNGLSGPCGGGTITAVAGSGAVSLSGAALPTSGTCTFSVNVTGNTAGVKNNSVTVSSTQTGPGNTANASVTVVAPPTISKSFLSHSLQPGGTTQLGFEVLNPNSTITLTGVGFTDPLPSGLVVSTPNGLQGTCGGGTITADAGSSSISLSGASFPPSLGCEFVVNVTAVGDGPQNNTTSAVTSNEGGSGGTANDSLTIGVVATPPQIPTLQGWALIVLALILALSAAAFVLRRRQ